MFNIKLEKYIMITQSNSKESRDRTIYPWLTLTVLSPQVSGSRPSIYSEAKVRGNRADTKIHCISSHLLFWEREEPKRLSPIPSIFKNLQNPIPHYWIQYLILNPKIPKQDIHYLNKNL